MNISTEKVNDTFLDNATNNIYEQVDFEYNIGISLTTSFLLCITTLVGILSNTAGLHILIKRNWRNHIALIQLLVISTFVCAILAPLQIIRTGLSFTGYRFMPLCQIQHFIHLHVDSCTFLTLLIITFERLVRIFKNSPRTFNQTSTKVITCCSWIIILPVAVYVIYMDGTMPGTISIFSYECLNKKIPQKPRHIVEFVTSVLFIVVLTAITAMYLIAVCQLHKKMSSRVGNMHPNSSTDLSQPATPFRVLQPREATTDGNSLMNAVNWFEYPAGIQTPRRQSMINLYNVPAQETERNSVKSNKFKNVLSKLKNQYIEIQPKTESETTLNSSNNELVKLRKLNETYQNQTRKMEKSSIAQALGKMTNISLFSFDQEVKNRCDVTLNPLKHTRRSAGNVWQEDTLSQNSLKPQNIMRRKKLPRKVIPKLKKQNSIDSIGTFSDTSGIVDSRTDSDISSLTFNTESNQRYLDDGSSIISVIIEKPEPESGLSRQHSTENKDISSELKEYSGRNLFLDSAPRADSPMRPRCSSTPFKSASKGEMSSEDFRKRAGTDGSNKPDRMKIKKILKKRGKRHKANKKLPPLENRSSNMVTLSRLYSSTDYSCSDSCQENERPVEKIPKSNKTSEQRSSGEYCDSNFHGSSQMTDSYSDLQSTHYTPNNSQKECVNSTTQTYDESVTKILNNSVNTTSCPKICIIEDTQDSKTRIPVKVGQNNWIHEQISPEKCNTLHKKIHSPRRSPSISMTNLRNISNQKSDMGQTVKRSIMIILSLALSYLPTCIAVFLLESFSTDTGLFLLQITRTIQYLYFAIIPTIYVHTNKGLQKTINRSRRG